MASEKAARRALRDQRVSASILKTRRRFAQTRDFEGAPSFGGHEARAARGTRREHAHLPVVQQGREVVDEGSQRKGHGAGAGGAEGRQKCGDDTHGDEEEEV